MILRALNPIPNALHRLTPTKRSLPSSDKPPRMPYIRLTNINYHRHPRLTGWLTRLIPLPHYINLFSRSQPLTRNSQMNRIRKMICHVMTGQDRTGLLSSLSTAYGTISKNQRSMQNVPTYIPCHNPIVSRVKGEMRTCYTEYLIWYDMTSVTSIGKDRSCRGSGGGNEYEPRYSYH